MAENAYTSALAALDFCLQNRFREWNSTDTRLVTEARNDLAEALTTRPTPEAQEAARYRWLRQFDIGIDHQGYDDYRWYAYAKPEPRNGRLGLDAVIDAALALPAQGEGK